jgi:putative addiction module killer protein
MLQSNSGLGYNIMEAQPRELRLYLREDGTSSFDRWLDDLRDNEAKARVRLRLKRIVLGNLGDYKSVGDGVYELRIDYGPGYRVYFGQDGPTIVVLLLGGNKGSQDRDILIAKEYWRDYEQREDPND